MLEGPPASATAVAMPAETAPAETAHPAFAAGPAMLLAMAAVVIMVMMSMKHSLSSHLVGAPAAPDMSKIGLDISYFKIYRNRV